MNEVKALERWERGHMYAFVTLSLTLLASPAQAEDSPSSTPSRVFVCASAEDCSGESFEAFQAQLEAEGALLPPPELPTLEELPKRIRIERHPATARAIAISTTSVSWGVLGAMAASGPKTDAMWLLPTVGIFVGPSAGHLYAGAPLRGVASTGLRVASFWGFASQALVSHSCYVPEGTWEQEHWYQRGPCAKTYPELFLMYGSAAVFVGVTAWDLWDAGPAVGRVKARRERRMTLAPSVLPGDQGSTAGLVARGTF